MIDKDENLLKVLFYIPNPVYKMNNQTIHPETLRKQNSKKRETPEQRETRLKRERERKRQKRAEETDEVRETRLTRAREQKNRRKETESIDERETRLEHEREYRRTTRNSRQTQIHQETLEPNQVGVTNINEDEHRVLQKFRNKMDNIEYKLCPVCKERIPLMVFEKGMCRRCNKEKKTPKRFSEDNNMDPGNVPEELQGLTEIEEMLIAQVFTV